MRQWKPVKEALFVNLLSDVLELDCLLNLCIVIHISQIQYKYNQTGKGRENCF